MRGLAKTGPGIVPSVRLALVMALLCGATGVAAAQGSFLDLFGNAFGGGDSRPLPQPDGGQDGPPLTVRAHPRPHRPRAPSSHGGSQRYDVATLRGVTIYTDKTLTRGDAVMTPTGLKVFNGSHSWPYTEDDFVALAESGKLAPDLRKELTAIDSASRPELRR